MSAVLVVGATRGLGAELVKHYATQAAKEKVYGTSRSSGTPQGFPENVTWLSNIDLVDEKAADVLVNRLGDAKPLDTVVSSS